MIKNNTLFSLKEVQSYQVSNFWTSQFQKATHTLRSQKLIEKKFSISKKTTIVDSGSCIRNRFSCTRNRFYIHPPLKMDEKCCQKAENNFAECNFQNSDKKYSAYGVHTKQLFLP